MQHHEIERRWLIKEVPKNLTIIKTDNYIQYQLNKNIHGKSRIRIVNGTKYIQTIKKKTDTKNVQQEYEDEVSADYFMALFHIFNLHDYKPVCKQRICVNLGPEYNNLTAEIDIFQGKLAKYKRVEVEFASHADMQAFTPPPWFGKDVTDTMSSSKLFGMLNKNYI